VVAIAPIFGGKPALDWLARTPLGLVTGAVAIQLALLLTAQLRAVLEPELRAQLVRSFHSHPSRWVTATTLVFGLAPLANQCGLLTARATGADLNAVEFVGELVRKASVPEFLAMALALTLLPALVEEAIFRGLVQKSLEQRAPRLAIAASALAFGVFHLDIAQGVATCILGLGFGYIVYTTGSLLGSMVAHAAYNLLVLLSQRFLAETDSPTKIPWIELGTGLVIVVAAARRLWQKRSSGVTWSERAS
jgi:membrane protease YdiL (CAAX protease family)